jgi:hypothetical protein
MKKIFLILLILLSTKAYCVIDTLYLTSKITDVTVFFNGAQVSRQVDLKSQKGKHFLVVDYLPGEINPQSIQVNKIANCVILSVKHEVIIPNLSRKDKIETDIQAKIDEQEFNIKTIKNKLKVFSQEETLLFSNQILKKGDNGTSVSEIKEAADYYRLRLNEIKQGELNLDQDLEAAIKKIQEFYVKLNEFTSVKNKTHSRIIIAVDCETDINTPFSLSYYINGAGWTPLYDFRVNDITDPLVIVYNANIYQSSGEDWVQAKLKLSTSNPTLTGNKPELSAWKLGSSQPYRSINVAKGLGTLKGRILDQDTKEPIPFANIVVYTGNTMVTGVTSDFDGNYTIKPIASGTYDLKVSYIGYNAVKITNLVIQPEQIAFQDIIMNASSINLQTMEVVNYKVPLISKDDVSSGGTISGEEISKMAGRSATTRVSSIGGVNSQDGEINGGVLSQYQDNEVYHDYEVSQQTNFRGSRQDGNISYVDGVQVKGVETSNYISNSLKNNVTNLEYTIDIPYTIPSDGRDYSIKIKEASIPVNYIYNAVPKIDNNVFLSAKIVDWTSLNLLSGKASLYYQGTYTGESFINADLASDTLNVSLGRDRNIVITREGNKIMNDKTIVGNNIKETVGWDITVRNNKSSNIHIIVEDQFPISEKKSIDVQFLEYPGAKLDEKTGKLTWDVFLNSNEKKVLNFKYSVKYPRDFNFVVE